MISADPKTFLRPIVQSLQAYVPGEQPRIPGLIKLNTNENPYPPSPKVLAATKAAVDQRLRLYPNPAAQPLLERLAILHRCKAENLIAGNGSDELLAMAVRCFVEPAVLARRSRGRSSGVVQFFTPSYSLYPVLADCHGAERNAVPLNPDFGLPRVQELKRGKQWDFQAALSFVTTPNAPSGRGYSRVQLEELCQAQRGVILLDEAYVDFAQENALSLALKYPHVLVARTFSKAYSLCFQRVGYCVGHPDLISALQKVRDSYNVNGLGQVAALATLDNLPYYRQNFRRIINTREKLSAELSGLGFQVLPSQTNFVLVRPPKMPAERWLAELRNRKILVRWFNHSAVRDYMRITIGTEKEAAALVTAAKAVLIEIRRPKPEVRKW
jgi:histidinol-phosphate aminotransferase